MPVEKCAKSDGGYTAARSPGSAAGKNQPASGAPLTSAPGSRAASQSRFFRAPMPDDPKWP